VAVPPRYDEICKDVMDDRYDKRKQHMENQEYYDNNRMLLSEILLLAKSEGRSLRQQYKNRGGNRSGNRGANSNESMCISARRSFADIGDIVKGTNLVDRDDGNDVEKHLKEMFTTLRQ
ncbi:putative EMP1-like protein, partial [Plasmodium gaboni]